MSWQIRNSSARIRRLGMKDQSVVRAYVSDSRVRYAAVGLARNWAMISVRAPTSTFSVGLYFPITYLYILLRLYPLNKSLSILHLCIYLHMYFKVIIIFTINFQDVTFLSHLQKFRPRNLLHIEQLRIRLFHFLLELPSSFFHVIPIPDDLDQGDFLSSEPFDLLVLDSDW